MWTRWHLDMYPRTCIFLVNLVLLIVLMHSTVFFVKLFTSALNSQFCALITIPSGWGFQTCLWGLKACFSIIINEIWVSKTPGQLWIHHLHLLGFTSALRLSKEKKKKQQQQQQKTLSWPEIIGYYAALMHYVPLHIVKYKVIKACSTASEGECCCLS